ncbi:GEM-like protein 4 isoform X2 [Benincasa hispida]|uniref:GEM-like protein 4 isoform X2 n=1 Tax=Benincasa hispida TaxID=102211 RepID=UPI0019019970|nr:GEM-like protein 4 isoform X2 [Benincasa hispida]
MASSFQDKQMVIGAPFRLTAALGRLRHDSVAASSKSMKRYNGKDYCSVRNRVSKMRRKANGFAHGIRDHLRLGPKIRETVKEKLRLGARIVKVGGLRKVHEKLFREVKNNKGEELVKASQCYLSTTAGPIAGLLFISTHHIAFCSDTPIKISSPNGRHHFKFHYKVVIRKEKVMRVNESENVKKASEKYIQIVTLDNFEFWFMGFLNYQSTFKSLKGVVEKSLSLLLFSNGLKMGIMCTYICVCHLKYKIFDSLYRLIQSN